METHLDNEVKTHIMYVVKDRQTVFEKLVSKSKMKELLDHFNKYKPQHQFIEGFGTASYREIHFKEKQIVRENRKEEEKQRQIETDRATRKLLRMW